MTDFDYRQPHCPLPESSLAQREHMTLFALAAAGKNAAQQAPKVAALLAVLPKGETPYAQLRAATPETILAALHTVKLGKYTTTLAALLVMRHFDLSQGTPGRDTWAALSGIGPKTASFIELCLDPAARVAVLDTHILAHLREQGVPAPKSTPQTRSTYLRLEAHLLALADASGLTPQQYDLRVWAERSGNLVLPEAAD
jgi:hypothetical protein